MQKLTPEQAALVEENDKLVPFILQKYFPRLYRSDNLDDWMQIGRIGLINAARIYDPGKGAFSSVAGRCIHNSIRQELRMARMQKRIPDQLICSFDETIPGNGDKDVKLADLIKDPTQDVEAALERKQKLRILRNLQQKYGPVADAAAGLITQYDAARLIGKSQPSVSRRVNQIKNTILKEDIW